MKTVYDLIRHHTSLEVICENCSNSAVLNNRFLTRRFGMMKVIPYPPYVSPNARFALCLAWSSSIASFAAANPAHANPAAHRHAHAANTALSMNILVKPAFSPHRLTEF